MTGNFPRIKTNLITVAGGLCLATGALSAQTIFTANSPGNTGAGPNGIAASPTQLLFTQPYSGTAQARGVYSENLALGSATLVPGFSLPSNGVTAENGVTIAPGGNGFTAGDVFATAASATPGVDSVYKNGAVFIPSVPAVVTQHQTALAFDGVGSFSGALIVSADTAVHGYNAAGSQIFMYPLPAAFSSYVLQAAEVLPLSYAACPGCLYVTAMPASDVNSAVITGNGEILKVAPGTVSGTAMTPVTATPFPLPESLHYVPSSFTCSLGPLPGYEYFAAGYSKIIGTPAATDGAILGWTAAQLAPYAGQILIQNELTPTSAGSIWAFDGTSFTLFSQTSYQLEDTAILKCALAGNGCPATQGFYHQAAHWPTISGSVTVDGITYNGANDTVTIGGIAYTQNQLLAILPSGSLHTGGYVNGLSQFVAAVLNLVAGAKHSTIDPTIVAINQALTGVQFVTPGLNLGNVPQSVQDLLNADEGALDNYNSAVGLGCQEASGLNVGH